MLPLRPVLLSLLMVSSLPVLAAEATRPVPAARAQAEPAAQAQPAARPAAAPTEDDLRTELLMLASLAVIGAHLALRGRRR